MKQQEMAKNKKVIFVIQPQSIIDVITNSSSELFIFEGKEKQVIEEMIKDVYPDYLNEYEYLKRSDELEPDELDTYIEYQTFPGCWPAKKSDYPILNGFTFEDLYEPNGKEAAWNDEIQYQLKQNEKYRFVTKNNFQEILNKIDPNRQMYFLFSINENPEWDYQEKLENIGTRIHLG